METKIYNTEGKETGTMTLPENLFGLPWNADLMHQVVVSMRSNARAGTANTKGRGEVRGGGRKPWQQKGTGRARHGSIRSPIWKGGGVTHGPLSEKNYDKKINRQARQKALLIALSRKFKDGELILINAIETQEPKSKAAKGILSGLAKAGLTYKRKNAALIALPAAHVPTMKSFNNFGNVEVVDVRNLNPISVLSNKFLILANPAAAIEILSKKKVVRA